MALSPDPAPRSALVVLRALGLGDLLTGVPALRALRRAYPEHEVVLATPAALRPLVGLTGAVDRLLDARELEALRWDGPPPDVAVNLHGRGPQTHRLLQALQPRRLVAFGCQEAGHPGPRWRADEHEVRRWCRLLVEDAGIAADPADLRLPRPGTVAPVADAVVVHPGAAFASRRWPADRYAAVARRLARGGHRVVVTGGPSEVALAEEVVRLAGLPACAVLAGRTDLAALAALVAEARMLVSGDTGVAHLATAFGTRSVLLFGPTSPQHWGPSTGGPHRVLWRGDGTGDPWAGHIDPALLQIGVADVVEAVTALAAAARTTPTCA